MNRNLKVIMAVLAATAVLWIGYTKVLKTMYLVPRAEALARIAAATTRLEGYRRDQSDNPRLQREIGKFADRTLGGDLETVDHKLRTRLNRLAEHVQLKNAAVGTTGGAKPKESPAKNKFTGSANKALRDEVDYNELEGWITGTGNFEQILQLVALIEAEPWIKRIDLLKLDPKDNGSRFNVNLRLTTLFLPKRTPKADPLPALATTPQDLTRYAAFVQTNPFRVPPPPTAPPVAETVAAQAPPPFPYDQWAVTGVAQSAGVVEIWLLNRQTRESRRLAIGESLQDIVLVAAKGETAEFRTGEQRFFVMVGANLSDRTPVNQ